MIEIFMLYEGKDVLSLCNDIRLIIPNLSLGTAKQLLSGDGTQFVTEAQLSALGRLEKLYGTFAVGKV